MNDAKFDYGMTAMSALMKGAQAEKKLPSSEKKLTASPVPEGKQYLKDQKEQIEKDILHIKDDNFTEENEELIYSEGAAAEESEAQARESAEEIAEAQEEEKRNKRNRRKSVIKLVVIAISITIVIIIGSIAWFTMNRENETNGVQMTATGMTFDIATKGANIRNSSLMSVENGKFVLNTKNDKFLEGSSGTFENLSGTSDSYYTGESILLRYNTGASKVGPDGCSELSLFVIPKSDNATPIKITLNVVAFAKVEKYDANGDPVYVMDGEEYATDSNGNRIVDTTIIEITNAGEFAAAANAVNNTGVAGSAASYVQASEYLKGHIMFFGEKAVSNADYLYTMSYPTREITKTIPAGNEGKAVAVPINWMWTNTLGQIVLKQADSKRDGKPVVQDLTNEQLLLTDTEKAKVIQYVKDNKDSVLANWTTILTADELLQTVQSESNPNPLTISQVVDGLIDNMADSSNFDRLSACYNTADRSIGTKIAYFMIEVSVESGN